MSVREIERTELATRLRELREACGLSGAELARAIGLTRQGLTRYETGESSLSVERLGFVLDALQATGRVRRDEARLWLMGEVDEIIVRLTRRPDSPIMSVRWDARKQVVDKIRIEH